MRLIIAILISILTIGPAVAHPHIWVHVSTTMLAENGYIQGFKSQWSFDEMYSESFLMDADVNLNKKLDAFEADDVKNTVFNPNNADILKFFLHKMNGKNTEFTFKDVKVWFEDDVLNYSFTALFNKPQPLKGTHKVAVFDPEFYVSFEQDLDMTLPTGIACTQELTEDDVITIYNGLVNPETYKLNCQ